MSRKRNSPSRGGKKTKDTPNVSLRRHRSGGKSQVNKFARHLLARDKNRDDDVRRRSRARRRGALFGSVPELLGSARKEGRS